MRALFLTVHHLISDFWSLGLLFRELEAFYFQEAVDLVRAAHPTFPDFVRWQERRLAGPRGEELWGYWSRQLDGAPRVLDLPTDRPRPAVQTAHGAFVGARFSPELIGGLETLARAHNTTLYTALLAGFSVLLHRWAGQDDLLLGSPTTGRGPSELAGMMGYFINPVVMRSGIVEGPAFAAHLDRTRETALAAFAHQDMPFPLLAERLQPERDPSRSPVFQVFFVLEQARLLHERGLSAFALGDEGARMDLLGLHLESLRLPRRSAQFDLMLLMSRLDGGLGLALEYNADLFDAATAERILGGFRTLLEGAVAEPSRPVGLLPLLTAEEQEQIRAWGSGLIEVPAPAVPLHRLFEEQAARRPEAVAAIFEVEELTYRRLNEKANRLAHRLRSLGVGPEVPVGLAVERGLDLLVGLLGILKAGGAYVPLDPSYPAERLEWIQEDAFRGIESPVVVTTSPPGPLSRLPAQPPRERGDDSQPTHTVRSPSPGEGGGSGGRGGQGVRVFLADPTLRAESAENPAVPVDAGSLAYVLYTSGSTGRPKGVMVTHGNVVRLLTATEPWFGFSSEDVWTLFHSFAFDFSVWEIWGALAFGGRLVVVPRETAVDTEAFRELLATERVTVLNQTPPAFRALTRVDGDGKGDLALRWVVFGGEALEPASLRPWFERHGDQTPRLVNMYGITETTVHVTFRPLTARDTAGGSFVGVPIPDLRLHAVDRHLMPVPVGVPGELCVGGAGLARGYRGRPDLTAERFVPDPFGSAGERLYRSGDLARFRPGSNGLELEYLGRIDHQVKVRGFRIELGEIESVLAACPAVQGVVVLATGVGSDVRLVAYVELVSPLPAGEWEGDGRGAGGEGLRAWSAASLPDYMVPSAFVVLDELPLTSNGKVDRKALAAIDPGAALRRGAERVAPRTATEASVARIWREILSLEEVGVEDDFFAVGGHSLRATELVARIARDLGVELPLHVLFSAPTVAGLAREIEERRGTEGEAAVPVEMPVWKSDPAARFEPFPLTGIQQAYWIGRSGAFDLGTVSTQSYLELAKAEMDLPRLERAWQRLVDRHDMLRAVVGRDGRQRVLPEVPPYRIEVLDLRGRKTEEVEAELLAVRSRMAHEVLPADRWPLFEIRATRLEGEVRLHARLDALIYDASSAFLLLQEWSGLYENPEAELEPLLITFREYVLTARELAGSPAWDRALAYWHGRAETLPPAPDLPLAQDPSALASHRFTRRSFRLPAPLWSRLKERASRAGIGPSALLAAAWSEVLGRWSRNPRFTLNLTLFQRLPLHPEVGRIVGDFTSLTLLEVDLTAGISFEQRAHLLQERLWRDLDNRLVSGLEALREMGRRRGGAPAGMPVVFTSTLGLDAELDPEQLPGRIVHALTQTSQVWLDHQVSEERGELVTNWDGVDALFPAGMVDDMFAAYRRLLDRLAAEDALWSGPAAGLGPVLLGADWLARLAAANDTGAALGHTRLQDPFFARAAEAPDAPAILWEGGSLTYGELAAQARDLGRRLREAGALPGTLVAVALEKSWQQVVAVLGVLDSGAAYLPLDPGLPEERFRQLLEKGECRLMVGAGVQVMSVDGAPLGLTPDPSPIALPPTGRGAPPPVFFPPLPGDGRAMGEGGQGGEVLSDDLAYVIFTSGSTGVPKGVAIDHRAALNTVLDVNRRFGIGPEDRVLALSSLSFDLSVWDIFGILGAGGALVLPEGARDPAAWAARVLAERVTVWNSVPALLGLYVEYLEKHPEKRPGHLRLAMMSGDWIPLTLPDRLRALVPDTPGIQVISMGGATEASIWSILYEIEKVDPAWPSIPYGLPMTAQTFHVLDEAMAPRPAWVPGMMWIGGAGVARGYWRDEAKTAASFVRHPETGERLYRTGDLGRRWPDGTIEILGREDFQVKIQGYRIELGEVEAALREHPEVREAVAVAAGDPRGERRLVAYVIADPAASGDAATRSARLRAWLEARLPRWMVPASIAELPSFPLNATGKVDRGALLRALAPVTPAAPVPAPVTVPAPADFTLRIARLVAEALGSVEVDPERLDPDTNLLELGASSLEVIRLANRLEEEFGDRPPVQSFYASPTLGTLIAFYEGKLGPAPAAPASAPAVDPAGFEMILDPAEREAFKHREAGLRPFGGRETLALPAGEGAEDLAALYRTRATRRVFTRQPVPLDAFAGLLAGLRRAPGAKPKYLFPSAGALYPVQAYLHVKEGRIAGLGAGTWYYHPGEHRLVPLTPGADLDPGIHDPFVNRPVEAEAAFTLFLVADLAAIAPIYGSPALNYALLEAGAMLQLLMMIAPDRGLGLCPIGQIDFPRVRGMFDLGPSHVLLHTVLGGGLDPDRESAPEGLGEAYPWVVRIEGDREEGEL